MEEKRKKRKVIFAIILALVLLLTLSVAVACADNNNPDDNPGNNPPPDNPDDPKPEQGSWALQRIILGGTYKTEYQLNEAFSADGLKVTASMKNTATAATRTDNVTADAKVESSRFNPAMVGTYVITVSYTNSGVTRYAQYNVTVAAYEPVINGISMQKQTVDYDIPVGQSTVNVNVDDITVKAINDKGDEEATPLAADAYTLSYYCGGQKVDNLNAAKKGSYTIQAERKTDGQKAFVVVYVLDPAVSIALKSGTVTQGQALTDNMSADWIFTVTNRSGTTCEVPVSQVELASINSLVPGSYATTATYNEYDGKGQLASADGIRATVEYSITKVDGMVNQSYALNMSQLPIANIDVDKVLNEAGGITVLANGTGKVKASKDAKACGSKSFENRFQFGGKSVAGKAQIKIDVKGPSLISVYARTTSAGRSIGLYKDSSLSASERIGSTEALTSTIECRTYLVEAAGSYYIAGPDGDVCIYYIQVDTVLTGETAEGQQSVSLPTATELSGIVVDASAAKTEFIKGEMFTHSGIVVSKKFHNPVTAEDTTEVITEGYTVSSPDMTIQGSPEVVVTYQGKTAKYTINVNSLVDGVNGIKASMAQTTFELDKASDTVEINRANITVKNDSDEEITVDATNGPCTSIAYVLCAEGSTEEPTSWTVGEGKYTIKVIATYKNTSTEGTTDFTAEITVTVKVKKSSGTPTNFVLNTNDLFGDATADVNITTATAWGDKAEIQPKTSGNTDVKVKKSTQNITIDGTEIALHRLETQGSMGSDFSRGIKITLEGACTIRYWAVAGTSTDNAANRSRYIKLVNSSNARVGAPVNESDAYLPLSNETIVEKTITVTAADFAATTDGIFYLGSGNSNVYIYYIAVEYTAASNVTNA